jgi:hypothetical protein
LVLDHNAEHLLHVIRMQQAIIAAHAHSLVAVSEEAAAAHGTMAAIAKELARTAPPPAAARAGLATALSSRDRHAGTGADTAIARFAQMLAQGAAALQLHPVDAPAVKSASAVSPQQLSESLSNMQRSAHDMTMGIVRNMR